MTVTKYDSCLQYTNPCAKYFVYALSLPSLTTLSTICYYFSFIDEESNDLRP